MFFFYIYFYIFLFLCVLAAEKQAVISKFRRKVNVSSILTNGVVFDYNYFPFGVETEKIIIENKKYVIKIFRKNKIEKLQKAILLSQIFNNCNFIPKLIYYNFDKRLLKQEYVGSLVNINKNLPENWRNQLNFIKKELIIYGYNPIDIECWDFNPYIINNLSVKNNKLYLFDFGDFKKDTSKNIDFFFDNLVKNIEWVQNHSVITLFFYQLYILNKKLCKSLCKKIIRFKGLILNENI